MCVVKERVYCCFQSPLSRFVNEQVKQTQPELLKEYGNDTWGTPKHPIYGGIPLEAVDKIDWDRINLDEWTTLLVSTGNAKTADGIDIDTLTGTASRLNWTGKMGNASDRGMPDHSDERTVVKQESRTDRRNVIERTEKTQRPRH